MYPYLKYALFFVCTNPEVKLPVLVLPPVQVAPGLYSPIRFKLPPLTLMFSSDLV